MSDRRIHVNPSHLAQNNNDGQNKPAIVLVDTDGHSATGHRVEVWVGGKLVCHCSQLNRTQAHIFVHEDAEVRMLATDAETGRDVEQRLDAWASPVKSLTAPDATRVASSPLRVPIAAPYVPPPPAEETPVLLDARLFGVLP